MITAEYGDLTKTTMGVEAFIRMNTSTPHESRDMFSCALSV